MSLSLSRRLEKAVNEHVRLDGASYRPHAQAARAYVIEIGGSAAGLVAADGRGYRFHAALHRFNAIDGQIFRNPAEAEHAARRLAAGGGLRGVPGGRAPLGRRI